MRGRQQAPGAAIAVFGSADPREGEPLYTRAYRTGALLASAGYRVVTGAYGGVMEAASRGAVEAGGETVGVACASFRERRPNRFVTDLHTAPDLHERTRRLVDAAAGFVVLPGKSGTMAELALLWALDRAGCLGRRPVVLLGEFWRPVLRLMTSSAVLEASQFKITRLVDDPEQAVEAVSYLIARDAEHRT